MMQVETPFAPGTFRAYRRLTGDVK